MKRGKAFQRWKAQGNYRNNRWTNWGELGPMQVTTGFEEEDDLDRAVCEEAEFDGTLRREDWKRMCFHRHMSAEERRLCEGVRE